jgi:hypothetical protein
MLHRAKPGLPHSGINAALPEAVSIGFCRYSIHVAGFGLNCGWLPYLARPSTDLRLFAGAGP